VKDEEILHRVKEERNILHTVKQRKANWTGHVFCRNCFLKHVIEENIERTRRRGGRHKQPLDGLNETRSYWNLKEEALDRTVWRTAGMRRCTCRKGDRDVETDVLTASLNKESHLFMKLISPYVQLILNL
jgi:hypothetical protein